MSNVVEIVNSYLFHEVPVELPKTKKIILIAIATIMALGMVFAFFLGAPWFVTLTFFALALAPLFPIWKARNPRADRVTD